MARAPRNPLEGSGETPGRLPDVPPSRHQEYTHDFTLQAVMEMQKALGGLSAKIDGLRGDFDKHGKRLDNVCDGLDAVKHWQSLIKGGAIVVGVVIAIAWALITFLPWNRVHIDTSTAAPASQPKP